MTKIIKSLAISIFFIFSSRTVMASSSDLNVKISTPKSPTNQSNFNVNFVALDLQNRPVTVKCFKKGPSDGGFSQFGSDFNLAAGGNSDNCVVDNSIVNTNGTYQFYVEAIAGSDDVSSNTVAVDYNTSGPSTPVSYSKEKISDCTWKIKFTTASDGGKTVRVEAYRSDNSTFNADSGNMFASIAIGSAENGETSITVPDCNKTWYFAVRAFDTASNGSGVIGDSVNTTTTSTTAPTPTTVGAILVTAAPKIGEAPATAGEGVSASTSVENPNPQVKGAATTNWLKDGRVRFMLILAVIVAAVYVLKKKVLTR